MRGDVEALVVDPHACRSFHFYPVARGTSHIRRIGPFADNAFQRELRDLIVECFAFVLDVARELDSRAARQYRFQRSLALKQCSLAQVLAVEHMTLASAEPQLIVM